MVGDSKNHCWMSKVSYVCPKKLFDILTFTLLSSPDVTRTGWPGTHSIAVIAPSWAPRIICSSRPPAFKSHKAMCPADEAEARIGCPSKLGVSLINWIYLKTLTTSKTKRSYATFHEHSHQSFICADVIDRYLSRCKTNTHNIDCRWLNHTHYCTGTWSRWGWSQIRRGEPINASSRPSI